MIYKSQVQNLAQQEDLKIYLIFLIILISHLSYRERERERAFPPTIYLPNSFEIYLGSECGRSSHLPPLNWSFIIPFMRELTSRSNFKGQEEQIQGLKFSELEANKLTGWQINWRHMKKKNLKNIGHDSKTENQNKIKRYDI